MRTKKKLPVILAIVIALAILIPVMAAPARAATTIQQQVDEITQAVEEIRGLTAKNPISFDLLNRDQLRDKLVADFENDWPVEERNRTQDLMVMLGFLQPGQDLYQIEIELLTEQVAGFYDPEDKKLYLITDQAQLSGADKIAMAHEICHALQDQYFNLDQPPFDVEDGHQDDAESAAQALVEGDAQRVANEYQYQYLTLSDLLGSDSSSSTSHFSAAPVYIQDSLLFPYTQGLTFVKNKVGNSNAKADDLFRNNPDSTEQIMHPSTYPANQPQEVQIPDLSTALGASWTKDEYNVLGEFDVRELFEPYLGDFNARQAADGWGGNLYEYWKQDGGQGKLLVQSYTWDTPDDAVEFAEAFETYIPDRFAGAAAVEQNDWLSWQAGGYDFGLKLNGSRTDVVQSTDGAAAQSVMSALGPGETIPQAGLEWQENDSSGTSTKTGTNWLVIGTVIALGILAAILVGGMLIMRRHYQNQ